MTSPPQIHPRHRAAPPALAAAPLAILLLGALANGEPSRNVTLDDIVEGNARALGGRERLDALRSVWRQRGERVLTLTRRPQCHLVYVMGEDGARFYAEGYDGEVAWEHFRSPAREQVRGRPARALWQTLQLPRTLNPLYRVREAGHRLELVGEATVAGRPYHVLELTLSNGFRSRYYVHRETLLIERSRNTRRHHARDGDVRRIETLWSDFRVVDRLVFPFVEVERDLDTGEILAGGEPIRQLLTDVQADVASFGLRGDYEAVLRPLGASAGR